MKGEELPISDSSNFKGQGTAIYNTLSSIECIDKNQRRKDGY